MGWDEITAKTDIAILILLVTWMLLDRCNIYFRKPKD